MSDAPEHGAACRASTSCRRARAACGGSASRPSTSIRSIASTTPTPIEETLAALDQLVRQGKVRYIGASSGYAWELMRALSVSERNGWARFVSMQTALQPAVSRRRARDDSALPRPRGSGSFRGRRSLAASSRARARRPKARRFARTNDVHADRLYATADWEIVDAVEKIAKERGISDGAGGARLGAVQARRHRADHRRHASRASRGGDRGARREADRRRDRRRSRRPTRRSRSPSSRLRVR